jgi:hypothetical protein
MSFSSGSNDHEPPDKAGKDAMSRTFNPNYTESEMIAIGGTVPVADVVPPAGRAGSQDR